MKQEINKLNNPSKIKEHQVNSPINVNVNGINKDKGNGHKKDKGGDNSKYLQFRRRLRKTLCR